MESLARRLFAVRTLRSPLLSFVGAVFAIGVLAVTGCVQGTLPGGGSDDAGGDVPISGRDGATQICTPGMTQGCSCPSGGTGDRTCKPGGTGWTRCQCGGGGPDVGPGDSGGSDTRNCQPSPESCDGRDNDCDGKTDENLTKPCSNQQGVCAGSSRKCSGGTYPSCGASQYGPDYEASETSCDGKDNNCNGQADETCSCQNGQTQKCGSSTGICQKGTQTCSGGSWGSCSGGTKPKQETCDTKDNDCDGQTDENCNCTNGMTRPCGDSTGACQQGTEKCSQGVWGSCMGQVGPDPETCDGKDNDCDGQTDDGLTKACALQQGVCSGSTRTCSGGTYPTCGSSEYGADYEQSESSCDGKDNDCDGQTDEVGPKSCSQQQGVCSGATKSCSGGSYGTCGSSEYGSDYETIESSCDGKDNDCDGQTDEGNLSRPSNPTEAGDPCVSDCECRSKICHGGTCAHRIFVTAKTYDGDLGGYWSAENKCTSQAHNAGLTYGDGDWDAVLSDDYTSGKQRASIEGPVFNMKGQKVADSEADFWDGTLDNAIEYDQNGNSTTGDSWTGFDSSGTTTGTQNCNDWSDGTSSYEGLSGNTYSSNSYWADDTAPNDCDFTWHLYCISD